MWFSGFCLFSRCIFNDLITNNDNNRSGLLCRQVLFCINCIIFVFICLKLPLGDIKAFSSCAVWTDPSTGLLIEQYISINCITEPHLLVLSCPRAVDIVCTFFQSLQGNILSWDSVLPVGHLQLCDDLQTEHEKVGARQRLTKVLRLLTLIIGSLVDSLPPHRPPPLLGRVG